MPSVALLIPLAELLGVTVTELLQGEKAVLKPVKEDTQKEEITQVLSRRKGLWIAAFVICLLVAALEMGLLAAVGIPLKSIGTGVLPMSGLFLLFASWLCLFGKEVLPSYYDQNRINYVSQGIFEIHMTGLSFHNGNWPHICTVLRVWTLAGAVLCPVLYGMVQNWPQKRVDALVLAILVGMIINVYWIGKKYE